MGNHPEKTPTELKNESPSRKNQPRCLLSLTAAERSMFFKNGQFEKLGALVPNLKIASLDEFSPEEWRAQLDEYRPELLISGWSTPPVPSDHCFQDHPLRYVCCLTGSVRNKVPRNLIDSGLTVTNWGPSVSESVAESALMLCLMALRRAPHWQHVMHTPDGWAENNGNVGQLSLFDRRVGLHGFGQVAKAFTRLILPFRSTCMTYSPWTSDATLEEFGVSRANSLEELFDNSEIIVELAALTDETAGAITEDLLRRLPTHGVFVNVGRGAIVDEQALGRLVQESRIRVGLDVFAEEPLPSNSPLRSHRETALTPHQAGPTEDCMTRVGQFALQNIQRYLSGEPLEAIIASESYDLMT